MRSAGRRSNFEEKNYGERGYCCFGVSRWEQCLLLGTRLPSTETRGWNRGILVCLLVFLVSRGSDAFSSSFFIRPVFGFLWNLSAGSSLSGLGIFLWNPFTTVGSLSWILICQSDKLVGSWKAWEKTMDGLVLWTGCSSGRWRD